MIRLSPHFTRAFVLAATLLWLVAGVARAEDPQTFAVGGFTFARPEKWQWVPVTSTMRKAQLKVGEDPGADITFFHFGTQGGDVESNIRRWLAQFKSSEGAEKIEAKELNGTKVTMVSTTGTFASGMPGQAAAPMNDYALAGAILEGAEGSVFVKMVGPEALVKATQEQFGQFIEAATKAKK